MKIRGNTVGTTLKPKAALLKSENLTPEEQAQARKKIGAMAENAIRYIDNTNGDYNTSLYDTPEGTYILTGTFKLDRYAQRFEEFNSEVVTIRDTGGLSKYVSVLRYDTLVWWEVFNNKTIQHSDKLETANNRVTTIDEAADDEHYPTAKAVFDLVGQSGGSADGNPVHYVKSTADNPVSLRSLESGTYLLEGVFAYYDGGPTATFSTIRHILVDRYNDISEIQCFIPNGNKVNHLTVTDDGYTFNVTKLSTLESTENRVSSIDSTSDDEHYPTAKAVYDAIREIESGTGSGTTVEVDGVPFTFTHGKNLFDESKIIQGEIINSAGAIVTLNNAIRSDYIYLPAGSYVYSDKTAKYTNFRWGIYDLEKTFKRYGTSTVITLDEDGYIVIGDVGSANKKRQLEAGTEATEYEAYYSKMQGVVIGGEDIQDRSITPEKLGFDIADMVEVPDGSITPKKLSCMSFGKNLIDETKSVMGEVPASSGAITENSGFIRTDYIYLEPGDYVYSNGGTVTNQFRWCQYDLNKAFVGFRQTAAISITEPCYIVIGDSKNSARNMQLEAGTEATEYEPYTITMNGITVDVSKQVSQGHFKKKTILFDGDSITEGTGFTAEECKTIIYPALVANALGMNFVNHAIGGSTAASKNPESDNTKHPLVLRFQDYTEDADIIYIAIGTNDWAYSYTEIGSMEDREDGTNGATPYTFYGALHTICRGLLNKYPGKAIIFATPIKRRLQESDTNPNAAVRKGKTLKEYGEIIKEVCDWYSIPVIDMYSECNITPFIDEQRNAFFMETSGGTHPNAAGHAVLARRVTAGIRSIIGL